MDDLSIPNIVREDAAYYESNLIVHKKKCHNIFNNIENGGLMYVSFERTVSENELGETYIQEISLEDTQYIRVSLLTDEILEYDLEMFRSDNRTELINKYKPFFTSFIVSLEENRLKDIEFLGDGWYIGQFVNSEEFNVDEGILLNGILETSASPVNYLEKKLLIFTNRSINKSVLNNINSVYDPHIFGYTNSSDIEKILNDAWEEDFPDTIDIYNVGHGNVDYIRGANHRILYDIGYNYRSFPTYHNSRYLKAVNAIRYMKPSCIILSHWDMDHIIGCAYAEQNIFRKKWIAPYLVSSKDKKASTNSMRLAHYLKALGNLCLVDREQKNKLIATIPCASDIKMQLWLGSGTSILTPKNREGLMINIYDRNKSFPNVLLAGDVPYQCMPNILKHPIDFMHVPHHCSDMELNKLISIPCKGVCAIISTNRKSNGQLNQNNKHFNELKKHFGQVWNTIDNSSKDDEKNLSIQIKYLSGCCYLR